MVIVAEPTTVPPVIVTTFPETEAVARDGSDEVTTYEPLPPVMTAWLDVAVPAPAWTVTALGVTAKAARPHSGPLSTIVTTAVPVALAGC